MLVLISLYTSCAHLFPPLDVGSLRAGIILCIAPSLMFKEGPDQVYKTFG